MNDEPFIIHPYNIFFTSSTSRLISQIMHSIPQVWYALSARSELSGLGWNEEPSGVIEKINRDIRITKELMQWNHQDD